MKVSNLSRYYDPAFKQRVLEYYTNANPPINFTCLAERFDIKGGHETVKRWHDAWNGKTSSLNHKLRPGRPPILNSKQMKKHILKPIRNANRSCKAIHYTDIIDDIRRNTNTNISLNTVRRLGRKMNIKQKRTVKRTRPERMCTVKIIFGNTVLDTGRSLRTGLILGVGIGPQVYA
jgi:transposase